MPVYYPRLVASGSTYCYADASSCYLEAPSPEAIREAAAKLGIPADVIVEVDQWVPAVH